MFTSQLTLDDNSPFMLYKKAKRASLVKGILKEVGNVLMCGALLACFSVLAVCGIHAE
jgi:hypothetical protein